jgi:hypothetical protein
MLMRADEEYEVLNSQCTEKFWAPFQTEPPHLHAHLWGEGTLDPSNLSFISCLTRTCRQKQRKSSTRSMARTTLGPFLQRIRQLTMTCSISLPATAYLCTETLEFGRRARHPRTRMNPLKHLSNHAVKTSHLHFLKCGSIEVKWQIPRTSPWF